MSNSPLRRIPSVNELVENPSLRRLVDKVSRNVVVSEVRSFLDNLRTDLQQRTPDIRVPAPAELADRIAQWIVTDQTPRLRPVINATGVLLHTGLGRAPLPRAALDEIEVIASRYASVEVDLQTGQRSQRMRAVEKLLLELTGAEAALVVNNNAAATLLALTALAHGQEVIVSRGQLVEIGGSYRLPEVMTASGARLREVGTTNKTRIQDYERAIQDETAALMRVHTSNYVISGFTEEASLQELVDLGHRRNLPVIDDVGSGALIDFSRWGLEGEPMVQPSITAGADLVLFSGDKLLGGPQCGIVVGRERWVTALAQHPLARAVRVGKLTLAALAATLRLYRHPDQVEQAIPLLQLLGTNLENLKNRAERLAPQLQAAPGIREATVQSSTAYLGGGSVPSQEIPTWCVALVPETGTVDTLARELRLGMPAILGRIQNDRLLLDLRSVFADQDMQIVEAVQAQPQEVGDDPLPPSVADE